jgi:hypothetical protein
MGEGSASSDAVTSSGRPSPSKKVGVGVLELKTTGVDGLLASNKVGVGVLDLKTTGVDDLLANKKVGVGVLDLKTTGVDDLLECMDSLPMESGRLVDSTME